MIIGQHEKRICYVDCFAGPWQEGTKDLADTSISISLNIIQKCREGLYKQGKQVKFRALYIEKEKAPFHKLKDFLANDKWAAIETKPLCGEFYDLRDDIIKWCGNEDFAFFFIDPKGWYKAIEIPTLIPFLQRPKSELLINFMFDFLRRFHTRTDFEKNMKEIFGLVPGTRDMQPDDKEDYLMRLYIDHIKKAQSEFTYKPRCAYVKIMDPYVNKTKYDLIYLTRHSLGIKVFCSVSEQLEFIQRQVRAQVKQNKRVKKTGQLELFDDYKAIPINENDDDLPLVKSYWLSKLTEKPKKFGIDEFSDMHEETGWFECDFQNALKELIKEKKVKNLNAKRNRPVHAVHFEQNEQLVKL